MLAKQMISKKKQGLVLAKEEGIGPFNNKFKYKIIKNAIKILK